MRDRYNEVYDAVCLKYVNAAAYPTRFTATRSVREREREREGPLS